MVDMPEPRMNCSIDATMSVIEGRWKTVILCRLMMEKKPLRFKDLCDGIDGISSRILTKQLMEMVDDGLLIRNQYKEKPIRVEYSLTEKAWSLGPVLMVMAEWGRNNMFSNRVILDDSIVT